VPAAGRRPGNGDGCHRVPLGGQPGSIRVQRKAVLLAAVREFAVDFSPPPVGLNGATGLYAGEQDLFCFLIDPAGWVEIDGEAFAPGFYV
jgi:hypothetical protein